MKREEEEKKNVASDMNTFNGFSWIDREIIWHENRLQSNLLVSAGALENERETH